MADRQIIHVDMDAFFASIEEKENPRLKGKPIIVGGSTNRSVVSAASYEARKYGVHSAMSMVEAKRLCPENIGVYLPVNMPLYQEYSQKFMSVLEKYSPIIEKMSIDEAFLEFTEWKIPNMTLTEVAKRLQNDIFNTIGLTASIGIATSRGVAKMASDFHKPNGITVVPPGTEKDWLADQPIKNLRGVGTAAEVKMRKLFIRTIGQYAALSVSQAERYFGKMGINIWHLANGRDNSELETERKRKSVGRFHTFLEDQIEDETIFEIMLAMSEDISYKLLINNLFAGGITLTVRYNDFNTITRSAQFKEPNATTNILYNSAKKSYINLTKRPVRLIGITATSLTKDDTMLLNIFVDPEIEKARRIEKGRMAVVNKYGRGAVLRARLSSKKKENEETDDVAPKI